MNKTTNQTSTAPSIGDVMNYKGQTGIVIDVRQLDYVVSDGDYRWNVDKYATKSYWPSKLAYVCPRSIRDYLAVCES